MREVSISVIKYDVEFTKRSKDLKRNVWFSFPNDLLLHPDFDDITGEELKWFIWCVSVCSKINNSVIRLNVDHACRKLNLKAKDFDTMCEKLQGKQIVIDTTAARPQHDRSTTATNITNNTIHNITNTTLQDVVDFWNYFEKLPKVLKLSKERKDKIKTRLNESSFDYKKAIPMILESSFLMGGGSTGWKADFDWFIANETNVIKILEGKYNSQKKNNTSNDVISQAKDQMLRLAEQYDKGEENEQG